MLAAVWSVLVLTLLCLGSAALGQGTGAPQITSADRTTFTIGSGETFMVTATGVPTPLLQARGTLPSGVSFTDNGNGTATLAGTPAGSMAGSDPLTISASNQVQPDVIQNFKSLRQAAHAPPLVNAAEDETITLPDGVCLEGSGSDDGLPSLRRA